VELLGVAGSLRRASHNRKLLATARKLLHPDVQFTAYEGLKLIPPFDEDDEQAPGPAVGHWRQAIASADAVLFVTPEYNASIPGQLKNAVDWASRPKASAVLRDKPVAVIGASTSSFGAVWAQGELRKALAAAGARVVDRELAVPAVAEAFDSIGTLVDRDLVLELESVLVELLYTAEQHQLALPPTQNP
jgi:chromate reductase, NAD(P)H dehydrogenase (quinone)